MAYNLKEEMSKKERFEAGHRLCAGCGAGIVCRALSGDSGICFPAEIRRSCSGTDDRQRQRCFRRVPFPCSG